MFALNTRPAASVAGARDPFSLMDSLFSDWLSARPTSTLVSNARIEVSEKDDSYEVRAELPGATKDDISVEVEGVPPWKVQFQAVDIFRIGRFVGAEQTLFRVIALDQFDQGLVACR